MKSSPLILDIKGNSLDDGPGIRTVLFFKGCPLNCVWCHNPESKKRGSEIAYDAKECIGCGSCIEACPTGALSHDNLFFIDRNRCTLCFSCVEACPSGALTKIGKSMQIEEIVKTIIKDKPFFNTSGGGITLSGGEPTIDMTFTSELMKELKTHGIHILIETCGFFNAEIFRETIYPYADIIYYDIKLIDIENHTKFCGVPNDVILKNFLMLNEEYKKGGIEILPRTPLIPGITDTEKNIRDIANFYRNNGVTRAALLSYNPLWHKKNIKIGIDNPLTLNDEITTWLPKEKEESCRNIFNTAGIELC